VNNLSSKQHANAKNESIIWKSPAKSSSADIIHVELAGITYPDKNYSIKRTRSQKRLFDNLFVIEYVVSGVGYIESEGIRARVSEGDVYIIHRQTVHTYYSDSQQPFKKKWINVSGSFINAMEKVFFKGGPFTVIHLGSPAEAIIDAIHDILKAAEAETPELRSAITRQLLDLFLLMDEHKNNIRKNLTPFELVLEYIDDHVRDDITVESVSSAFFISQSTLYRMFISKTGMSPKTYIMSKKIDIAKRMIIANDTSFSGIATYLGFYDSHHFFRTFRSVEGCSPLEYRKKALEKELGS